MYYPEVSPTAPVSRDDLAQALLAQQAMGLAGGQQAGDANSMSMDALGNASAPGYDVGAPGQGFGIGRDAAVGRDAIAGTVADNSFGSGAMTTSNASMTTSPDAVVGGPFGGRGGEDREGFGSNVNDPALASPTLSDPGYSNVSVFGREGDTTSPSSQAAQAAQAAAMAAAAMGRNAVVSDPDALPEGMGGKGDRGYVPGGYTPSFDQVFGAVPSAFPAAVPTTPEDINDMDKAALAQPAPSSPTFVGRVTPNSYTQPTPDDPGDPNDPGDPGTSTPSSDFSAAGFSGFGGFGAFGGGAATGGYEGSASMGNTTGAQGFTAGGGGYGDFGAASPGTGGMTAGGAVGGFGGGDGQGGGAGDGGGAGTGGGSEGSGSSSDSGAGAGSSGVG